MRLCSLNLFLGQHSCLFRPPQAKQEKKEGIGEKKAEGREAQVAERQFLCSLSPHISRNSGPALLHLAMGKRKETSTQLVSSVIMVQTQCKLTR